MSNWIKNAIEQERRFFANASGDEIEKALDEADYEYYKNPHVIVHYTLTTDGVVTEHGEGVAFQYEGFLRRWIRRVRTYLSHLPILRP